VAVVSVDIDGFAELTNSLGPTGGDRILQSVASRLSETVRSGDTVARPGSDEFVLILGSLESRTAVRTILERLYERFREPFQAEGREVELSVSSGVAFGPADYQRAEDILRDADIALQKAKKECSGNYVIFEPHMREHVFSRMRIGSDLRGAIERDEFSIVYQPIVDAQDGVVTRLEALLRWDHPDYGSISPEVFIPIAEENGSIVDIGEWVLASVARQRRAWRNEGYESLRVEVNLSPTHFRDTARLIGLFQRLRAEYGLQAGDLGIELTETTLLEYSRQIADALSELVSAGVEISIDDFSTGYASMDYLKRLPVGTVKIDKSFVRDVHRVSKNRTIVTAMAQLSQSLGIRTVAEGVETEEERSLLEELGCHELQGYFIAKPMDADALRRWLEPRYIASTPLKR
jgi:diguanylate cyclase (GGDEF)-like protein